MSAWPRGAEWRMWDLHVHTPDSLFNKYSGSDPWDRFLSELAALPKDLRVVGINDYWFLTGYERVRSEFAAGNLPNLDAVFPIVEVRCDSFGGVDGNLRRINLHFICDPLLDPAVIQVQLISSLKPKFRLSEQQDFADWSQVPSLESLKALGRQIKDTVDPSRLGEYGSDLVEGFNNVCVPFETAVEAVERNTALADHVILAIGKTEWEALKWNDQSIATKKNLINSCALVFTAAADREAASASLAKLRDAGVNSRLLDCSDAHTWTGSADKDRLGNVFTWINADPTFKGLRQVVREYEFRVTMEPRPEVLARRAQQPDTFIDSIAVRRPGEPGGFFDFELPINPGFVAVVGNKGQGKSALLDLMAHAASSDRAEDFSFLTPKRFLRDLGVAAQYETRLTWLDGITHSVRLSESTPDNVASRVDYLPQSLIEKVCAADPDSLERRQFEAEIERVVFRHIPEEERGESASLRAYLKLKTQPIQAELDAARASLRTAAEDVVRLQERQAELLAMSLETRATEFQNQIAQQEQAITLRRQEFEAAQQAKGEQVAAVAAQLADARAALALLQNERGALVGDLSAATDIVKSGTDLSRSLLQAVESAQGLARDFSILIDPGQPTAISVLIHDEVSQQWLLARRAEQIRLEGQIAGLDARIVESESTIAAFEAALSDEDAATASMLQGLRDAELRREHLLGDPADANSLRGLEALQEELKQGPALLALARQSLELAFAGIHKALLELLKEQDRAYGGAAEFVSENPLLQEVGLDFGVEFRVREFKVSWAHMVNRQRLGDLAGLDTPLETEDVLVASNLMDTAGLYSAVAEVESRLSRVKGAADGALRPLGQVMRSGFTAADLLNALYGLHWLQSQYVIRSDNRELRELSPGQRGLVLLMFYLLVDRSSRPLLLDQPEENLDNQTVKAFLVPALRQAVQRRQVIAVTHNPNLAIVGDADQIVVASHQTDVFSYESGSLADLNVGTESVDVLEGTRAAFDNRGQKYAQVVGNP